MLNQGILAIIQRRTNGRNVLCTYGARYATIITYSLGLYRSLGSLLPSLAATYSHMPFILTFGSFGDFVTAIQILRQVQQALRDAEGSWTKYQGLVNRISAFQVLLVQAGGLRLKDIDSGLKNALDFHVSQAEEAAKTFLLHIGGYHASLSPGGTGRWFLDTWKRVRWNIRGGDVKEFLEAMRDQTIAIGLLLSTVNVLVRS